MNPGPTSGRVYEELRQRVTGRQLLPGDHLDPAALASALAASTTPVREALSRLVGEGLVETRQGVGFHIPLVDEPSVRDLYGWIGDLAALALRTQPDPHQLVYAASVEHASYAEQSAATFLGISVASGNHEHAAAMRRANARLHGIRLGEAEILVDVNPELDTLRAAMRSSAPPSELRRLCMAFVRRRQRAAADLVRRRYRGA
jgi:DNA-binding GntR family transcriptional regulator